jgi:hypothetical protein
MTEEEWLACADPQRMLGHLGPHASDRKNRLLSLACCLRLSDLLQADELRHALTVADQWIEGVADSAERKAARRAVHSIVPDQDYECAAWAVQRLLMKNHFQAGDILSRLAEARLLEAGMQAYRAGVPRHAADNARARALRAEQLAQCHLVREVFGNPFRPVAINPAWLTSDVVLLARGIYEERAFDRLPILADALQDAGCDSDDILDHLRDANATHVRGCWALDLVLGRK